MAERPNTEHFGHRPNWAKRLCCRIGLHPKPPVLYGDDPWPLAFTCEWCGGRFVDYGPAH